MVKRIEVKDPKSFIFERIEEIEDIVTLAFAGDSANKILAKFEEIKLLLGGF